MSDAIANRSADTPRAVPAGWPCEKRSNCKAQVLMETRAMLD
jgi:hypothetical protein